MCNDDVTFMDIVDEIQAGNRVQVNHSARRNSGLSTGWAGKTERNARCSVYC